MTTNTAYPSDRPSHFAHKFTRLLVKVCAAQEIGLDGVAFLSIIAHTEDAKGYRGPVTFFNSQLIPVCGLNNVKALTRLRDRIIGAGWLHYESGKARHQPGRYWALIPPAFEGVGDGPSDEDFCYDFGPATMDKIDIGSGHRSGQGSGHRSGQPSSLLLTLPLIQEDTHVAQALLAEFTEAWNSLGAPFPRITAMNGKRVQALRARQLDKFWLANWRAALAEMPTCPFLRGEGAGEWIANVDWFLRPDTVQKIMEGNYKPINRNGTHKPGGSPRANERTKHRYTGE